VAKTYDIIAKFPGLVIIHQRIPSHQVGRHQHEEHEFFLPLQGEITVNYDGKTVKAGPGRMLYVPPDLDHSFSSSSQGSGERVIWLVEKKTWKKHFNEVYPPSSMPMNSLVKELIFYLLIHQKSKSSPHFISALVESLRNSLNATQLERQDIASGHILGRTEDQRIRTALEILEEELSSISLAEVAKRSGLSLRNFNRLFLKECGLGPKDYIILRRVEKAKTLLRESKMTVTDISLEVGYNSLSKFIAIFKKIVGVLPSDYRLFNQETNTPFK